MLSEASERVATVSTSSEQAALAARAVTHDLVVVLDPGHGGGDPGRIYDLGDRQVCRCEFHL